MPEPFFHPSRTVNQCSEPTLPVQVKAPVQTLQIILQRIVTITNPTSEIAPLLNPPDYLSTTKRVSPFFSVRALRHPTQICYVSALPQILARGEISQIFTIVEHLLKQIDVLQEDFLPISEYLLLPEDLLRGFTATSTPSGNIQFQLHDSAIAYWLNTLLHRKLTLERSQPPADLSCYAQRLFAIQHAHARCCSLLRHAQQKWAIDFLIKPDWQDAAFTNYPPIPWLTFQKGLQLTHLTERQLIVQLLAVLDLAVETPSAPTKQYFLLAEKIGAVFQDLLRACPLFGAFLEAPRDRLQVHAGLILITQRVLLQLLQSFSEVAPFEL